MCFNICSLRYIDENVKNKKHNMPFFMVSYLLNNDGPQFSPNLKKENDPNFFGLVNSLLESTAEIGSCMERIDDGRPSYYVKFYYYAFFI